MNNVKFTRKQNVLKAFLFGFAAWISFVGLTAPVHEFGHLIFGKFFCGGAEITGWSSTRIYDASGFGGILATLGGAWGYSLTFLLLYRWTWKSPVRSIFLACAIFGTFGILLPIGTWNYGLAGHPDSYFVPGYWLWVVLWWGAWYGLLFRKILRENVDNRHGQVYNYDEWQADIRRRSAETRKNLSR